MNKISSISLLLLTVCLFQMNNKLMAQYRFGLALGLSHERQFEATGNHLRFYFNFDDHLQVHLETTRYFEVIETSDNIEHRHKVREINTIIQYSIFLGERLGIYPLLGFNYTFGNEELNNNGVITDKSKEDIGLNFGDGLSYKFGRITPYLESKSILSSTSYGFFIAGLRYSFGKYAGD